MSKRILFIILVLCFVRTGQTQNRPETSLNKIAERVLQMDRQRGNAWQLFTVNGKWKYGQKVNWLSGFLGGELWQMYALTGRTEFRKRALAFARSLLPYVNKDDTHDMGFIFYPTVVRAYRFTKDVRFKKAALRAAQMLLRRYNAKGHFIRAWGKLGTPKKEGWSIIDTMMNLQLLFWATRVTGDGRYQEAAYAHAITSMKQNVRPDGSTVHVVVFDAHNGKVLKKQTHQGAADSSVWARGQAWGIYGFATAFKYTDDERFLRTACRLADFMIARLDSDYVPFWDLTDPRARNYKDASAAAVLACGLYRLSDLVYSGEKMLFYQKIADRIVRSLLKNYLFWRSKRKTEQGLLLHQVYNFPKHWAVDESYPAGDYYFTKAYARYRERYHYFRPNAIRQRLNFDKNWLYLQQDLPNIEQLPAFADRWQRVDLPHTWNRFDVMDGQPGYRRKGSWYRKIFFVPQNAKQRRWFVYFEDANETCKIWLNGKVVGGHTGGYLGFKTELTDALMPGAENELLVYVSNAYDPDLIPSQKSDFFIYGGLTRDVWLEIVPQTYMDRILISVPQVSEQKALTDAKLHIHAAREQTMKLRLEIFAADHRVVVSKEILAFLKSGINKLSVRLPEVKKPHLWSPKNPYRYTLRAQLLTGNKVRDRLAIRFGYRWFEFKEHGPFFLNGKRLLLRGTHRHEEHAGYGAAMPNALHIQDMVAIKNLGANFVRLAHYPQDPAVYRACDSLGLLVWDELPWCRGGMGGKTWQENTERMLREQILQNYNHPSVIIWSLGNELNWLPDFVGGSNDDSLKSMLRKLNDLAHSLDPYRITAVRKYEGAVGIVDLFSPSIWAGWYSGVYENFQKALENSHRKYPRFFLAEYGGASHYGRHNEQVIGGNGLPEKSGWEEKEIQTGVHNIARNSDWSENYIVDLFDWHLHVSEQTKWLSGTAQWIFRDFGTPLRPQNPIPYVNEKGLTDRAGKPKDGYYVFKSYWNTQDPFCYIESHTWRERYGPKGKKREVCVYSNCSQVELFLNGRSLGKRNKDVRKFPAQNLHWYVPFKSGRNRLIALGFKANRLLASDTLTVNYRFAKPEPPRKIVLRARKIGAALYEITALALDAHNNRSLNYNKRIYFSALQGGKLVENYGTPDGSSVIEMSNGKAQIRFRKYPDRKAVIEVRNQDFKGSYLVLPGWQ